MSELRISLRRLLRSPGYIAAAVLSLAIGTAVCVAAFSLVNVMVFEDVPGIRDRRNLIRINWTTGGGRFTSAELETLDQLRPPALGSLAAQGDTLFARVACRPVRPRGGGAGVGTDSLKRLGTQPVVGQAPHGRGRGPGCAARRRRSGGPVAGCVQQRPGCPRTLDRGRRAGVHDRRCHAGTHARPPSGGPRLAGCDAAAGVGRPESGRRLECDGRDFAVADGCRTARPSRRLCDRCAVRSRR